MFTRRLIAVYGAATTLALVEAGANVAFGSGVGAAQAYYAQAHADAAKLAAE